MGVGSILPACGSRELNQVVRVGDCHLCPQRHLAHVASIKFLMEVKEMIVDDPDLLGLSES